MIINANTFASYLIYLLNSGTRHSVHSPFVYKLIDEVIKNKREQAVFRKINTVRGNLIKNPQLIEITEFARKRDNTCVSHRVRSIGSITRESAISEKYGRLLYRLAAFFKPETVIELGTSLGISTMYLAMANANSKVVTIDACTIKSEQAEAGFKSLGINNIEQHIGLFGSVLPGLIKKEGKLDFAFFDGNHFSGEIISCFESLLTISHNDTVFVFHEIHSSDEMEMTWEQICENSKVTASIDLFGLGVVFLRKELSRQRFVIRY